LIFADPILIALRIPALLIAVSFHEFAHARVAYYFGDSTAKRQGRMNLNPINHLDPIGTIMILLVGFGWAKPVPINPYNFNNYRRGIRWVSFAGPLSNLLLAFLSLFIYYSLAKYGIGGGLFDQFMEVLVRLNVFLAIFNMIPIPPLDGSKILMSFLPAAYLHIYRQIEQYAPIILIILIVTRAFGVILYPLANAILRFYNFIIFAILGI